jgi:hypothetical protein
MNTSISCILTFENENDAVAIINIINNGSKTFPSSSSLHLTADFNKVSTSSMITSKESKQETLKRTNYRPQLLYASVDDDTIKMRRQEKRRKYDMI